MKDKQNLFSEFAAVSTADWEAKIKQDLKGAEYNKKLIWKTIEGIKVKPYYRSEDIDNQPFTDILPEQFPFIRGNKNDNNWLIRQDIKVENMADANQKALRILNKGITALGFVFADVFPKNQAEFSRLMQGIQLDAVELFFDAGNKSLEVLQMLSTEVKNQKLNDLNIRGSVNYDFLGKLSSSGKCVKQGDKTGLDIAVELVEFAKDNLPNFRVLHINGELFHNAGADAVQELTYSLSAGNEYLARLTERGISINELSLRMHFSFAVGTNYFMEIAKLRAARLLWSQIVQAYQPCCEYKSQMLIHTTTSRWNMTAYDPHINLLRGTTESMSGIIGGTDIHTVTPFDTAYKTSDEFSERMARNIQIILKEESYLDRINDPAAGSYYIESLTMSVAETAWQSFQAIEKKGGYIAAFTEGFIQEEIEKTAQKRLLLLATRRENLLGTNQFPNGEEKISKQVDFETAFPKQVTDNELIAKPLKSFRLAEEFEKLRLKTEQKDVPPSVFMFTYGKLNMRKARAAFATNFFACGGFNTIDNFGFPKVEAGIAAAQKSHAEIVVICSSDEEYPEIAPAIYKALNQQATVVIAGYPKDSIEELQQLGIQHFIHVKSNVLEELKVFQRKLN